jgi:hypothetical protein
MREEWPPVFRESAASFLKAFARQLWQWLTV